MATVDVFPSPGPPFSIHFYLDPYVYTGMLFNVTEAIMYV